MSYVQQYKIGDRKKVENYRDISLQNIGYEILSLVTISRLQTFRGNNRRLSQIGFRIGRSTYLFAKTGITLTFINLWDRGGFKVRAKQFQIVCKFFVPGSEQF